MFLFFDRKAQTAIQIVFLCVILLAAVLIWLVRLLLRKRHLRSLGVDAAAKQLFAQELQSEHARFFGDVLITESWAANRRFTGLELFPLSEVEFFKKDYSHRRYLTNLLVTLRFKDGKSYDLPCISFEQQDEMMALLTERCPQANQRDYGTYV